MQLWVYFINVKKEYFVKKLVFALFDTVHETKAKLRTVKIPILVGEYFAVKITSEQFIVADEKYRIGCGLYIIIRQATKISEFLFSEIIIRTKP